MELGFHLKMVLGDLSEHLQTNPLWLLLLKAQHQMKERKESLILLMIYSKKLEKLVNMIKKFNSFKRKIPWQRAVEVSELSWIDFPSSVWVQFSGRDSRWLRVGFLEYVKKKLLVSSKHSKISKSASCPLALCSSVLRLKNQ